MHCTASLCSLNICSFHVTFLKILTSVLNRFHSVPPHRVNCQLLSSETGRGNLLKAFALRQGSTLVIVFFVVFFSNVTFADTCHSNCSFARCLPERKPLRSKAFKQSCLWLFRPWLWLRGIAETRRGEWRLCSLHLRGLLKFHRHLGIPYMPRKPITHLQTDTQFDSDSEKTLSQITRDQSQRDKSGLRKIYLV